MTVSGQFAEDIDKVRWNLARFILPPIDDRILRVNLQAALCSESTVEDINPA